MICISVSHFAQWRASARSLLQRRVLPTEISWNAAESSESLFAQDSEKIETRPIVENGIHISKTFLQIAENVACFRDPQRWALLYRIAWRLVFEDKSLLNNTLDDDIITFYKMNKSISRDKHKMAAFVRFQSIKCINDLDTDDEYYVAWFEPEHLIVPIKISFFVKRFTNMRWSILTPDMCAHWDLHTLQLTAGVKRPSNLGDELESLWLTYYQNIFNPARLKTKAMQSEMPKKYWKNLPEAALIKDLTRGAQAKTELMINTTDFQVCEKNQYSKFIDNKQKTLRDLRQQADNHKPAP